jgi:hypothetical protein
LKIKDQIPEKIADRTRLWERGRSRILAPVAWATAFAIAAAVGP